MEFPYSGVLVEMLIFFLQIFLIFYIENVYKFDSVRLTGGEDFVIVLGILQRVLYDFIKYFFSFICYALY